MREPSENSTLGIGPSSVPSAPTTAPAGLPPTVTPALAAAMVQVDENRKIIAFYENKGGPHSKANATE